MPLPLLACPSPCVVSCLHVSLKVTAYSHKDDNNKWLVKKMQAEQQAEEGEWREWRGSGGGVEGSGDELRVSGQLSSDVDGVSSVCYYVTISSTDSPSKGEYLM